MAITHVASTAANANTLTLPSHQAGDILVIAACNTSGTAITAPAGWIQRSSTQAGTTGALTVFWKTAQSNAETSGTWTNADQIACACYRSDSNLYVVVGSVGVASSAASTTINYSGISATAFVRQSGAWVIGIAETLADFAANTPPTGMTNRVSTVATGELAIHDTNANVTSWTGTTVATSSVAYRSVTFEIYETDIARASGGGLPLVGPGGLVY